MTKRASLYRFTWVNKWFMVKAAILAIMWYGAYLCFDVVKEIKPLKTFIPHEILGVAGDATVA